MAKTMLLKDTERAHKQLFKAHASLRDGADQIHAVAVTLYDKTRHSDQVAESAPIREKLERARDLAAEALHLAASARTDLLRATGCDGRCTDTSPQPQGVPA